MPGCDCGSYPVFVALTVYVSGASEMNENEPDASVVLCAVCDGDAAVTVAPASGACVAASTTRPRSVPVVPALATDDAAMTNATTSATVACFIKKSAFKLAE